MNKIFLAAILIASGFVASSTPVRAQQPTVIYVQTAPPQPETEPEPALPGPGYVWVPGYYQWTGSEYVWVRGHYVQHAGAWCAGEWRHDDQGWYFVPGHWC